MQKTPILIAYQGEQGSYSEAAALTFFKEAKPKPCKTFSDVFRCVEKGQSQYGVVPIENSIEGSVNQVYDLFLEYDLKVCREIVLEISHCLITNPYTELNSVQVIYSHPQALA
ncbi:MAG: hypothetical protein HWN68_18355, partial [Desulfobacterales bacterium]|nr:hypothetical protein [Desulfobacterales bacterium]